MATYQVNTMYNQVLTGTVSVTAESTTVTGSGTSFTTELSVGDFIGVDGEPDQQRIVSSITNNTELVVTVAFDSNRSGAAYYIVGLSGIVGMSNNQTAELLGYYALNDFGAGNYPPDYVYDSTSTLVDNGGTIIEPGNAGGRWVMDLSSSIFINSLWMGASTSLSNNQVHILAAFGAAMKHHSGGDFGTLPGIEDRPRVYTPKGVYPWNNRVEVNEAHTNLEHFGEIAYLDNGVTNQYPLERHTSVFPDWSPHTNDFRIVDEQNSTVYRIDAPRTNAAGFDFRYRGGSPNYTENILFRNIAINGGRTQQNYDNNDSGLLFMTWYNRDNVRNITFQNCAGYKANRSAFIGGIDGIKLIDCLAYNNGHHGFGYTDAGNNWWTFEATGCEAHHHLRAGMYGFDFGGKHRLIDCNSHHNSMGMKSVGASTEATLINCKFNYNRIHGYTTQLNQTDAPIILDMCEAHYNGRAGFRLADNTKILKMFVKSSNNGLELDATEANRWPNIASYRDVDTPYFEANEYGGADSRSLRVIYNDFIARSGQVKDSASGKTGVDMFNPGIVKLYHVVFGGAQSPDINAAGTFIYGKLVREGGGNVNISGSGTEVNIDNTPPAGLDATVDVTDVTLTCNRVSSATSYVFMVASDANFNNVVFAKEVGQPVSGNPSVGVVDEIGRDVLNETTTYYYRVYYINESDPNPANWTISEWSSAESLITGTTQDFHAPQLLSPNNGVTGVSVNPFLDWAEVPDAVTYNIIVADNALLTAPVINETGLTAEGYQATGLAYNTEYYWKVTAVDAVASEEESAVWSFTTQLEGAPSKPTLTFPGIGATGVALLPTFKWGASSGATHYGIAISVNSDLSFAAYQNTNIGNILEFTLPGGVELSGGQLYYWQVTAYNAEGNTVSDVWHFTTITDNQILITGSTSTLGGWTVTGAASGHAAVAELSDGSYIGTSTIDGDPCVMKLVKSGGGTISTPLEKTGWAISNIRPMLSGSGVKIVVKIIENYPNAGGSVRATFEVTTETAFANFDFALTAEQAGGVVDANDLYLSISFESMV